jgi:hypothetical protein
MFVLSSFPQHHQDELHLEFQTARFQATDLNFFL